MKTLNEQEIVKNIDDNVTAIIEYLITNSFGNAESRRQLSIRVHQLAVSKDPRARKLCRELGNALTNIGQKLLELPVEDHELGNNFKMIDEEIKKIKPYISLFELKGEKNETI